jgi:hypothetical protein
MTTAFVVAVAILAVAPPASPARVPADFFGIAPQTALSRADTERMRRGGLDTIRVSLPWSLVQPNSGATYDWAPIDRIIKLAARSRLRVLPFIYSTPGWVAPRPTILPVKTRFQRRAWGRFLRAAVERYGPRRNFRGKPIRRWQIWNEANFFYFTEPVSPGRYGRLLKMSHHAISAEDPRAELILSGLFADPHGRPSRARSATSYLRQLYSIRGIKRLFDGVALHPYAADTAQLKVYVRAFRRVMRRHGDRRAGLYITEMGWGSQGDSSVSFEKGLRGQARELRRTYTFLLENRRALNLRQIHWFTWKDKLGICNFCDSVGLFRRGARFRPKPAWRVLQRIIRSA